MKIIADGTLPCLDLFRSHFLVECYQDREDLIKKYDNHAILLCRSTLKVDETLLQLLPIKCLATASSGIDHVNLEWIEKKNIAFFSAKGCNAQAVADYVSACVAFLQQKMKIKGKKTGIVGLGKVGTQVKNRLEHARYEVLCYDPINALNDKIDEYCAFEDLYDCDILSIHANLHDTAPYPSKNLLNADFFRRLSPGTAIINASRGGIVNEADLLQCGKKITYCTDVYLNEPDINPEVIAFATLCTPHIAGHSIEAKDRAVHMLAEQIFALFHMPFVVPSIKNKEVSMPFKASWADRILSLYNPSQETTALKNAPNLSEAFIQLRKKHNQRHDFEHYQFRD